MEKDLEKLREERQKLQLEREKESQNVLKLKSRGLQEAENPESLYSTSESKFEGYRQEIVDEDEEDE
eukprot:CAMPEP_0204838808 /NCGR_PEP_ID=MMETSP1346-20131115/31995_1 /ASSEMBLY_ACC=CAM_ASM_000771 /TAXON_ID=215587 /ORGANISM="Aplanochytrium stocchinoi, Strain GSBS06" /LENGTH=66 /DNA_ID=CAMNT_0051975075 /DNA_START=261 /DNA_END=458 /DNA_ORIENTATION=+